MNNQDNEKVFQKSNINWFPGHMAKAKREIIERISLIDMVIEVIDARIPYSSKNNDIDNIIKDKPRLLVMTKRDLCDDKVTDGWKSYYEDKGYQVLVVDLVHDKNMDGIIKVTNHVFDEMNHKRKEKGLKSRKLRVLILGIPNVGKSTLINRLVKKKVVNVGNKPGITKSLEWIRINDSLELLDTPGILWPRLEQENVALNLASMTAIKEEILNIESVAIYIINMLMKYYKNQLVNRYSLDNFIEIIDILDHIGMKIGAVHNGEVDYDRVYTTIIRDLREGRLGKVTFDRYENR